MRKLFKWVLIGVGALLVLGIIGTLMTPDGRRGFERGVDAGLATATSAPTEEPTPTEAATPTEEPTPEPTPKPTPKPTPEPETGLDWILYASDRYAWLNESYLPAIEAWDTSGSDLFESAYSAIDVWSALLQEQSDLTFVEPAPCYAQFHADWSAWVDRAYEGFDLLTDGGIEQDLQKVTEAITIIEDANAMQGALTEQLEEQFATCG